MGLQHSHHIISHSAFEKSQLLVVGIAIVPVITAVMIAMMMSHNKKGHILPHSMHILSVIYKKKYFPWNLGSTGCPQGFAPQNARAVLFWPLMTKVDFVHGDGVFIFEILRKGDKSSTCIPGG